MFIFSYNISELLGHLIQIENVFYFSDEMSISKKTKTDIIAASIKKYLNARNIDQQPKVQVNLKIITLPTH